MPDGKNIKADSSAEQAYAAAAAEQPFAGPAKAVDEASPASPAEEATFPSKAKRARKPVASTETKQVEAQPVLAAEPAAPPAPEVAAKPAGAVKVAKPRVDRKVAQRAKPVVRKALAKPGAAPVPTKILMKPKPKTAAKRPLVINKTMVPDFPNHSNIKDSVMDMSANFTESFKTIIADAQEKAKDVFSKGNAAFGDYNEFAKGNVDAVVESGKILAAGLQDMGTNLMAESRSAFEAMTADIKELTAVKSPADFFRMQSDFVRRNFDSAVAYGSKNTEAMLKLASEAAAPLSGRVSVAVEKVRQSA